jgi:bifunctional UDP-N-acetylglucosamine pyrophosphorylase/glucosamine-1-phosphate N-acetyltransferase
MHISCLILAAGKGTRMKSSLPKVLHPVFFQPMVCHVLDAVGHLPLLQTTVVVGHQAELVRLALQPYDVSFAVQHEQNGTGHAVLVCQELVDCRSDTVLILCGDTPLVRPHTLLKMMDCHQAGGHVLTVMGTRMEHPKGYGRLVSDAEGQLLEIVEEKDASAAQRRIREVNAGIYLVQRDFLFQALATVDTDNAQGEVYLTDIVAKGNGAGLKVASFICDDPQEVLGVNSRQELARAHDIKQQEFFGKLWDAGVSLQRPSTLAIHPTAAIGSDSVIQANCTIDENVIVGQHCLIGAHSYIKNSSIGDDVMVGAGSVLVGVTIGAGSSVAPGTVSIAENVI